MWSNHFIATSILIVSVATLLTAAIPDPSKVKVLKMIDGNPACSQPPECNGPSIHCCNKTIGQLFADYQFDNFFLNRNTPISQAAGFWDHYSFITAASDYEHLGFGTTGGKMMQMKEIAAILAHIAAATTCGSVMSTGGPLSWGLCYKKEMSPSSSYCNNEASYDQRCVPGAEYYLRGALPISGNEEYAVTGEGLKMDLLSHPEILEQNATVAFKAAILKWMTKSSKLTPSAHNAFVGNWKLTKNDTRSKRFPGFGATMNILYGYATCGNGDQVDRMNTIVSHYLYFLDLIGVGRENAEETHESLTCGDQIPFPRHKSSSS